MARCCISWMHWIVAFLFGAAVACAQSNSTALHLALKGYDPVAYFTDGRAIAGKPEHEIVFEGVRYRFLSADHLQKFKQDPDRFLPQFAGSCAGLMSKGIKAEADPENWLVVDGKLYVFLAPVDKQRSRAEFDRLVSDARANWPNLKDKPFQ